jgi:cytochrome c553
VPRGSIARGKALVTSGEKTAPCSSCHGSDLRGSGDIPPLIGRSPSYLFPAQSAR